MGYCYLFHFSKPIGDTSKPTGFAQHYLGYTSKSLKQRTAQHNSGYGAKITAAAIRSGAELILVRYWSNCNRSLERELKRGHQIKRFCPICYPERTPKRNPDSTLARTKNHDERFTANDSISQRHLGSYCAGRQMVSNVANRHLREQEEREPRFV